VIPEIPAADSEDSGQVRPDDAPFTRNTGAWEPRRSLAARMLWYVVPVALVPAAVYWIIADRIGADQRQSLLETLIREARSHEARTLSEDAADRLRTIGKAADEVASITRRAAEEARRVLEEGPDPKLPAEELVDEEGGVLHSPARGVSAAIVSRLRGLDADARRDLAATRRLEAPFVTLGLGPMDLSALSIRTATGVLRVVPGLDLSPGGKPIVDPRFRFPSDTAALLADGTGGAGSPPVVWTSVYEDTYAGRGNIASAVALVRGRNGRVLAEVGVNWVFPRIFQEIQDPTRPSDVEFVFAEDGRAVLVAPEDRFPAEQIREFGSTATKWGDGTFETKIGEGMFLAATRHVPDLRWTYAKVTPREAVEKKVADQLQPIFAESLRRRNELRLFYVALVGLFGAAVVVATRRALAPLRRVARAADAVASGRPSPHLPESERLDEVGRLSRAMTDLDRRVRWRIASMEGVQSLAQTAALMTRPEETYQQLTRQIASLVGATKAWISLWEPETRSLALTPPGFGVPDEALRGRRVGLNDQSLAIFCYRTGETCLQNDVAADPRISKALLTALNVEKNIVFAPLKAEVGILGVLAVADKPGGFDAEDQSAIDGYAGEAALLLRNARLYEELQRSYERLRDAQRNRDYFLQNINHELRTPLTAILGWSEVLAEDRPDRETMRIAVDQINRSTQFLLALISDLLDLSRFEEGRTRLEPEEVDLGPLVTNSVEPVSVMAEAKGIRMTLSVPQSKTIVRLDPLRVRQVLWNLVHNAVKFTPKGGEIRVEAGSDEGGANFTIADNGVGIDAKDLPLIFERFRQIDGSSTRAYRGMGIGLALAKAFVELHGGTIRVDSQPGRGTTFHIRLPRIASGTAGPPEPLQGTLL
jgi:signal transduction histidine kinase/HAMP domain-containing protein